MDYKATLFLSEDGSFPYKTVNVTCMYIEEISKTDDKKNTSTITLYIDNRRNLIDKNIKANNHNFMVREHNHTTINNSNDLRNFINNNQTYLIRKVESFKGNLSHIII